MFFEPIDHSLIMAEKRRESKVRIYDLPARNANKLACVAGGRFRN